MCFSRVVHAIMCGSHIRVVLAVGRHLAIRLGAARRRRHHAGRGGVLDQVGVTPAGDAGAAVAGGASVEPRHERPAANACELTAALGIIRRDCSCRAAARTSPVHAHGRDGRRRAGQLEERRGQVHQPGLQQHVFAYSYITAAVGVLHRDYSCKPQPGALLVRLQLR